MCFSQVDNVGTTTGEDACFGLKTVGIDRIAAITDIDGSTGVVMSYSGTT